MKEKRGRLVLGPFAMILLLCCSVIPAYSQLFFDIEGGVVATGYNDVRIPNQGGTPFSLKDDLAPKVGSFLRVRPGLRLNDRHNITLLYAPLRIKSSGTFDAPVRFRDAIFEAERATTGEYVFNSYRATYRYDFLADPDFRLGVGLTAKVRDAAITLTNADTTVDETNVGFVPLVNFYLHWMASEDLGLLVEGDALVGPQGRAEDVFLGVTYRIAGGLQGRLGYRILEGGADADEVYNFALVHYAALGAVFWL